MLKFASTKAIPSITSITSEINKKRLKERASFTTKSLHSILFKPTINNDSDANNTSSIITNSFVRNTKIRPSSKGVFTNAMRKEFNKDVDPVLLCSTRRRQSQTSFKFNGLVSKSPNKRISRFSNSIIKNPSISLNRSQPKQFKNSNKNKSGNIFEEQSSPHLDLIETFKGLLDMGIPQAKFFLKKEILNCEEKNEKFNLDKILKVNYFCEEVETMSITIQNFRNSMLRSSTIQPPQGESDDGTAPCKENTVDNINTNVLRMASERRISVYQNLFEDMKKTFDDVIKISNYQINHNRSTQILIDLIEEDNDSNPDDNKFINIDCIKPFFSGISKKKKSGKGLEIISSIRSCIDKSSSSISSHDSGNDTIISLQNDSSCFNSLDDINSLSEGIIEQICLPLSRIRTVSIENEVMARQGGHIRKNTMKDALMYEKKVRTRMKTYMERQTRFLTSSNSSSMSDKENQEMKKKEIDNHLKFESLASLQKDINIFLDARKELQESSKKNEDTMLFET